MFADTLLNMDFVLMVADTDVYRRRTRKPNDIINNNNNDFFYTIKSVDTVFHIIYYLRQKCGNFYN